MQDPHIPLKQDRVAVAMEAAERLSLTSNAFKQHLKEWGLTGREKTQEGMGWAQWFTSKFQAHFLENFLECVVCTRASQGSMVVWQKEEAPQGKTYTLLSLNESTRTMLLEYNTLGTSTQLWPFLKQQCSHEEEDLHALLTWSRLAPRLSPSSFDSTFHRTVAQTFSTRTLFGTTSNTRLDLPALWKEATSHLEKITDLSLKEPLRLLLTKVSPDLDAHAIEEALKKAPLFATELWMIGTLKLIDVCHLTPSPSLFERWCATTSAWPLQEGCNFWSTVARSLTHFLHADPSDPLKEWSDLLDTMPLKQETWLWLVPLLDAEYTYADKLSAFALESDTFKASHHSLAETPATPRWPCDDTVPPYLYAHTLFMKMKNLLKEVGPPSQEQWSVLYPFFDKTENTFGKMAGPVYAAYLSVRLMEEAPPLSLSRRVRV